jgi:hypothetical protein
VKPSLRAAFDALDGEPALRLVLERALDAARIGLVRDGEAALLRVRLELLAGEFGEPRREACRLLRCVGLDGPVFLAQELLDLRLALADESERDALHAPRGESRLDLLPQQR